MDTLTTVLIGLIILFHVYVFILEAFLWKQPKTRQAFGTTPETAASSYKLAINQGVYNLFLAAGLIAALIADDPTSYQAKVFFLACIVVAAITGGLTASKRILLVQGLPALAALILVISAH